jgi:phosphonate transport system substrate-binding protein
MPDHAHLLRSRAASLLVICCITFVLTASVACRKSTNEQVFRLAVITTENQADTFRRYDALVAYLRDRLQREVEFREVSDYAAIIEAFRSRRLELAYLGPASYAKAWKVTVGNVEPLAVGVTNDGMLGYHAAMLVRADSPYFALHDLRGKTFAYVDPNSTSGYQAVHYFLHKQGIQVAEHFSRTGFSGSHENSIIALLNHSYDAATVWWNNDEFNAVQRMALKGMVDPKDFRVVWLSPPLPPDPWTIRKDLPLPFRQQVREALLRFRHEDPDGWKVLTDGKVREYVPADQQSFQPVLEMIDFNLRQRGSPAEGAR